MAEKAYTRGEMDEKKYTFGNSIKSWHDNRAQTITFIVTDDCNLRCKYCYITHKSSDNKMDFETAKIFIDNLLTTDTMKYAEAVIVEFIGGEPLIEVKLIDQICDYFKLKAFILNHDWYWNYRISICTNGINYSSLEVQEFIKKNYGKISITISLDGNKEKHDMQRVFPDGTGSYDIIEKNIDLWLSQFRGDTKVTFASDDLPLLYDSIISLWNGGIKEVSSNVVFENVWKDGDDKILEEQLKKLADYVIENEIFNKGYYCSFFSDSIGFPYSEEQLDQTYCGAGKMIALSSNGNIYPCIRYYGYSLNNHDEWSIGDIINGIDMEKVRPFVLSTNRIQSDNECLNCEIASGCAFCQGFNYDEAPIPTNFYRAKYICRMHKARVRANEYYFSKLYNKYGIERSEIIKNKKQLYFLLSDDYVTYCSYYNSSNENTVMDENIILKGLEFVRRNFYNPIFVHGQNNFEFNNIEIFNNYDILHIIPFKHYDAAIATGLKRVIPVYNVDEAIYETNKVVDNVILNIKISQIKLLGKSVANLLNYTDRINLNITELTKNFNEEEYRLQMSGINDFLFEEFQRTGNLKEVSLLTDILFIKEHDNCMAGLNTFILSPHGKLHTCCGEYSNDSNGYIGSLDEGIIKNYEKRLYEIDNSNLCRLCDSYQCKNCVYINRLYTKEFNVSPSFQCRKSHIERELSANLLEKLKASNLPIKNKELNRNSFLDPITLFIDNEKTLIGYYKFKQ